MYPQEELAELLCLIRVKAEDKSFVPTEFLEVIQHLAMQIVQRNSTNTDAYKAMFLLHCITKTKNKYAPIVLLYEGLLSFSHLFFEQVKHYLETSEIDPM